MTRCSLLTLAALLGPAALLALGCGPSTSADDGGTGSDSTSADDGGGSSDGGASSSAGSTGNGTETVSSSNDSTSTEVPPPPCGVVRLADIAEGIGGFAVDGASEHDESGNSVNGAGDINGDGIFDVTVGGAPHDWYNSAPIHVVFGKADTDKVQLAEVAEGVGGFAVHGEGWSTDAGYTSESVGLAGDTNGDGLADILVGNWEASPDSVVYSGRAYVAFGKADKEPISLAEVADGIGGFAMDGEDAYDSAGRAVSGAGDVNGDGLADVVVGAPHAEPGGLGYSGRTYVLFGKTNTEKVQPSDVAQGLGGFVLDGEAEGGFAGATVSGAGDVNGDGLADVLVGADERAYVVFGKASTENVQLADVAQGNGGFALDGNISHSSPLSGAGDVNGDGLADVLVGVGDIYVVFGKASTENVALADVAQGNGGFVLESDSSPAHSVSEAGDVNGDGLADVIVGAHQADPNGIGNAGRTYVVFGKGDTDSVSLADVAQGIGGFALDGEAVDDHSGWSVSGAGDMNGDGLADLIVGARGADPNGDDSGRTYVVFGGDFSCGG